ncbi:alpha/beta hydrolase [Roseicyclus sp. F158]|uniref:Alpha/beta hydrolase n=1 Tax=Tropicimonas omnivorans TaxID=3075590 RepID=A0ABU3DFR5_9RHOB|nr:alpha/beta hydrolase [Roseicyclus sp. F158]MDT0682548.1 alpha/beta hydrolase [Roseicyclus sp. F158]
MTLKTIDDVRALITANPVSGTPPEMRAAFARLAAAPSADDVGARPLVLGTIDALSLGEGPTLLWLHGGGLVFGGPETHLALAAHLAGRGLRVVLPAYRLAPDHVWPAQIEDTLAALDALSGPVAIGGDSAGGLLALEAAQRRPGRAFALALLSPNTDRTGATAEVRAAQSELDAMNDDEQDAALARLAFEDRDGWDPEVSPRLGPLDRLPPTFLAACPDEVLSEDARLLADGIHEVGGGCDFTLWDGMFHMWPLWPNAIPEGAEALDRIAAFVQAEAARSSAG